MDLDRPSARRQQVVGVLGLAFSPELGFATEADQCSPARGGDPQQDVSIVSGISEAIRAGLRESVAMGATALPLCPAPRTAPATSCAAPAPRLVPGRF